MIAVNVRINNTNEIASLSATRTRPMTCTVDKDTECTYQLKYHNTPVGTLVTTSECGIDLAKQMLNWFKENGEQAKAVHMLIQIGELK